MAMPLSLGRSRLFLQLCAIVGVGYLLVLSSGRRLRQQTTKFNPIFFDDANKDDTSMEATSITNNPISEPKKILFWTPYYDRKDMLFGFGQEPFIKAGCKVTNCWATNDRSFLDQSDAIIFSALHYNTSDLPSRRLPNQRYVFLLLETIPNGRQSVFIPKVVDNVFNWTMTHRRDSDIYYAMVYGAIRRKKSSPPIAQLPPKLGPDERPAKPIELLKRPKSHPRLANKTKLLAWFCSNRETNGKREHYIERLSKHMPVDIYGQCGNLTCLPRNSPQCNNLLDNYKFYLSAENSLCPDYVSEKFYRALGTDVVPVVYGGADYSAYAPPHSYIHVADFESPRHLAEYLQLLDKNEALYLKYFEWKKDYEIVQNPMDGWCDMCEKLNDPQEPSKTYTDLGKWWYDDVPCYKGSSFLKHVLNDQ